jgi:hypothetical protein
VSTSTSTSLPPLWRIVAAVALLVALALLAVVLARWGWRWFGPAPVAFPPSPPAGDPVQQIAAARLFGAPVPMQAAAEIPASGDLRLLGVFAERDGNGYALFRQGTRGAFLAAAGSDIASGLRLEAVHPEGVTLLENGTRREIVLRPTAAQKSKAPAAVIAAPKLSAACTPPEGFRGPVVRLNAELLSGMIRAPETWQALLQTAPGALVVRDQSGFAGMMGLKAGDRVERANGVALMIPADVASAVLQPLTRSQQVWVSGTREGKPQHWLYLNAGACPS